MAHALVGKNYYSDFPTGDNCPASTPREDEYRSMLEHGSMPELHAKRLLLNIDHACIVNREQIVECLAALVRLFPDEIKKQAPDGRRLHAILVSFAAPARLSG
jgi:hypothetical protein